LCIDGALAAQISAARIVDNSGMDGVEIAPATATRVRSVLGDTGRTVEAADGTPTDRGMARCYASRNRLRT
jgi:hypothetical protein